MTETGFVPRTTVEKPVNRDAWLAARREYFNASSASVLFDRHPYQTPGWYAAMKLTGEEQSQNRSMKRGIILETPVAEWWADENGVTLYEPVELFTRGRMMATVDRFIVGTDRPVEIKTTGRMVDDPLPYWLDQCQAVMWCTGADTMDLVWLDGSMELHSQEVDANAAFQIEMADRAERFMAAIDLGIVPDWVQLDASNIASIYPDPAGQVELDEQTMDALRHYVSIKQQIKEAEAELDAAKDVIANVLGDKEAAVFDGRQVVSWKATKGFWQLDAKAIEQDHPELFDQYKTWRKGSRRFVPTV